MSQSQDRSPIERKQGGGGRDYCHVTGWCLSPSWKRRKCRSPKIYDNQLFQQYCLDLVVLSVAISVIRIGSAHHDDYGSDPCRISPPSTGRSCPSTRCPDQRPEHDKGSPANGGGLGRRRSKRSGEYQPELTCQSRRIFTQVL